MDDMFEKLAAHFPPDRVSWRVGAMNADKTKGMALAYIDARDVMERLDAVCGPAGWERRHPHVDKTTTCEISIWVDGRGWVVKSDGAGDTDVEAEKGSLSDSFKRAAVNWGVGRYLYDLPSPWIALEAKGRSHVIPEAEHAKLRALLTKEGRASPKAPEKAIAAPQVSHEESSAVGAAKLAIDMCKSVSELTQWQKSNANALAKFDAQDADNIVRYWNARFFDLKPKAVG